ncbi:adenosine 5'-monophosphoramidase HINT3-like [Planococcus citri]|uniref:adenosine 5'-monophosphoramidase HINT3-like n=1 Tax=Planococcus citri TaxID=170843 RepID=UPI0031F9B561
MANPTCIFCSIIAENGDNIIFQNDELIVIRDIKPASKYHFLIIPKNHIADAKSLTPSDKPLLERMIDRANVILEENQVDMNDIRLAFHWPPFRSVPHLHLHAIAPASQMSLIHRISFKPGTWWCVSPEYVLQRITE